MMMINSSLGGIYKIENMRNGKCYVGSAVVLKRRLIKHKTELNCGKHHSQKLQRAWDKYGADAFLVEVIEYVDTPEKLVAREQEWIDTFRSAATGYNICGVAGSILGTKRSAESVAKTAAAHTGMRRSDETRKLIREARAKQPPMSTEARMRLSIAGKGRVVSEATRAKLSAANRGAKRTAEQNEANRQRQLGRKLSEEAKEKVRIASTGRKHTEESKSKMSAWQIGRKMSEEAVAKMVAAKSGFRHSEESKERISRALVGRPKSEEQKKNMAAARLRPETVAKRAASMAAAYERNKGAKRSEEQKQRMREGQARRRAREAAELGTAPQGESFQK